MPTVAAASRGVACRRIPPEASPDLVYFSSASGNTHRFIEKLERPSARIPLRPRAEGTIEVTRPYVLVVPSYGGGGPAKAIPPQVRTFLNNRANRRLLRGVMISGNTNFCEDYGIAGRIIAEKCHVPLLYRFELLGTSVDVANVRTGLEKFWATIQDPSTSRPSSWRSKRKGDIGERPHHHSVQVGRGDGGAPHPGELEPRAGREGPGGVEPAHRQLLAPGEGPALQRPRQLEPAERAGANPDDAHLHRAHPAGYGAGDGGGGDPDPGRADGTQGGRVHEHRLHTIRPRPQLLLDLLHPLEYPRHH